MTHFSITEHLEFNKNGRTQCPSCAAIGKDSGKSNLALIPNTNGAYKCHRGCTPEEIREALGVPKTNREIPKFLAVPDKIKTYSTADLRTATNKLFNESKQALDWLHNRGITDDLIERHRLGVYQGKTGSIWYWGIGIPIKASETSFFIKRRNAPWKEDFPGKDWTQTGIPASIFWGHKPQNLSEIWLCEGEWDAILLGDRLKETTIGVASFTCGCKSIPRTEVLSEFPDIPIKIFYDLDTPGETGAAKVKQALGDRAEIKIVPAPPDPPEGWDISNALLAGFTIDDLKNAQTQSPTKTEKGDLWQNIITNDQLLDRAADYTDWLVPDLISTDEMFLLAASPRAGKSLMAFSLAHAVATGGRFLGRPCTRGTVLYIRLEDSEAKTKEREIAQGWERGTDVYWLDKFSLDQTDQLDQIVEKLDVSLVVIDTLSRARRSDISESAAEMSHVLEPLADIAKRKKCSILLVHHTNKIQLNNANNLNNVFDTIRGSSAIRATCRGTMVLAATENNYRLCYENGWGKGDLKVVLDANKLEWRVLEQWRGPTVPLSQKDQVMEVLNRIQQGTIEQIAEATQLPKRSLYEVLKRLQAEDIVEKRGNRRQSIYVRKSIQQIQQLNSLLNSCNSDTERDTGVIQQDSLQDNILDIRTLGRNSCPNVQNLATTPVELLKNSPESLPEKDYSYSTAIQHNSTAKPGDRVVVAAAAKFQRRESDFVPLPQKIRDLDWIGIDLLPSDLFADSQGICYVEYVTGDRVSLRSPGGWKFTVQSTQITLME